MIVPAWNAAKTIGECLTALSQQTWSSSAYEVIVVDDGSTDETPDIARQDGVRVITQAHAGRSAARNAGARLARGDILLFTDADCEPAPDWISQMAAALREPGIVAVKGAYQTKQHGLLPRFTQLEYQDKYDRLRRQRYVEFVDSYSAGYRRSTFIEYGGFDSQLAAAEDVELSFRLAQDGHRMVFHPQAVVYHHHGTSLWRYLSRKFSYGRWRALVYARHPDKILGDGHTPREMFLQIPLAALLVLGIVFGAVYHPLLIAGIAAGAAFLLSTLPFVLKAWNHDRAAALVAPALLLARSLALGAGLVVGALLLGRELLKGRSASDA